MSWNPRTRREWLGPQSIMPPTRLPGQASLIKTHFILGAWDLQDPTAPNLVSGAPLGAFTDSNNTTPISNGDLVLGVSDFQRAKQQSLVTTSTLTMACFAKRPPATSTLAGFQMSGGYPFCYFNAATFYAAAGAQYAGYLARQ